MNEDYIKLRLNLNNSMMIKEISISKEPNLYVFLMELEDTITMLKKNPTYNKRDYAHMIALKTEMEK